VNVEKLRMIKDIFIAAHEELVNEYLDRHPQASQEEAYEKTGNLVYDRYREKFAGLVDDARQKAKYGG